MSPSRIAGRGALLKLRSINVVLLLPTQTGDSSQRSGVLARPFWSLVERGTYKRQAHVNAFSLYCKDFSARWRQKSGLRLQDVRLGRRGRLWHPARTDAPARTVSPARTDAPALNSAEQPASEAAGTRSRWRSWKACQERACAKWRADPALRATWRARAAQHRQHRGAHHRPEPAERAPRQPGLEQAGTLWQAGSQSTPLRLEVLERFVADYRADHSCLLPASHPAGGLVTGPTSQARQLITVQDERSAIGEPADVPGPPEVDLPTPCWQQHPGLCRTRHSSVFAVAQTVQLNLNSLFSGDQEPVIGGVGDSGVKSSAFRLASGFSFHRLGSCAASLRGARTAGLVDTLAGGCPRVCAQLALLPRWQCLCPEAEAQH